MAFIGRQTVGAYTYLYEVTSFRDDEGRPRNHRKRIGKVDRDSGKVIYDDWYLERLMVEGKPFPDDALLKNEGAKLEQYEEVIGLGVDASRFFGAAYTLETLAEQIGLTPLLKDVFPLEWSEILGLACFLVESHEPMYRYDFWASNRVMAAGAAASSQRISELVRDIDEGSRNEFYARWISRFPEKEYDALDITSISSYSELMKDIEWGYNRDHEDLAQLNLCALFGEQSHLPLYQTYYMGSLNDMTTLQTTLDELCALVPARPFRLVMDKGFYKPENVAGLLRLPGASDFLLGVPFVGDFPKEQVRRVKDTIRNPENTIATAKETVFGSHSVQKFPGTQNHVHVHVFLNPETALSAEMRLNREVKQLQESIHAHPNNKTLRSRASKYLRIRSSTKSASGLTATMKTDAMNDATEFAGFFVVISKKTADPKVVLNAYRYKDVVEKNFDRLKNVFDLRRLRVHDDERARNVLFIGFIAQIIVSEMYYRMNQAGLLKNYTLHEALDTLERLRMGTVNGKKIMRPLTRKMKDLLTELEIPLPVV